MPAPVDEDRILNAALEVWREEGLRDATTRKVADRAGVGEVTLFRRFGNKASLFAAALAREAARFESDGVAYTGRVREDVAAIAQAYARMLSRNIAIVGDFLTRADRDATFAAAAQAPMQTMLRVGQILAQHQAAGRLRAGPPTELLLALLGPMVMRAMLNRVHPNARVEINVERSVDRFLEGWRCG